MAEPVLTVSRGTLQKLGRNIILRLAVALKNVHIYDASNVVLGNSTVAVVTAVHEILAMEDRADLSLTLDNFFLNDVRIRTDIAGHATFRYLMTAFTSRNIGAIRFQNGLNAEEVRLFCNAIHRAKGEPVPAFKDLCARIDRDQIRHIQVAKARKFVEEDEQLRKNVKARSVREFFRSIRVTKDLLETSDPKRFNFRNARRVVQSMVDIINEEECVLLALTTIKNYDNYTYNHSSNVAVYSLAVGQRLGLGRGALANLGMAGLLHDVGKTKIPLEILNKPGRLDPDEWDIMKSHSVYGAEMLLRARELNEPLIRNVLVAFEHHLNLDLGGYPELRDHRDLNLFSRIVAVADCFDALTTPRVYRNASYSPQDALSIMMEGRGTLFDPVLLKIFVNAIGIHPVGTLVQLSTGDVAVVFRAPHASARIDRPFVRIIERKDGRMQPGRVVDLSETNMESEPLCTIEKTVDPSDHFESIEEYLEIL